MDNSANPHCFSCEVLARKVHDGTDWTPENPFEIAPNLASLEKSARSSCQLCCIILVSIIDSGKTPLTKLRSQECPIAVTQIKAITQNHHSIKISIDSSDQRETEFFVHIFTIESPIEELIEGKSFPDILKDSFALLAFLFRQSGGSESELSESGEYSDDEFHNDVDTYSNVSEEYSDAGTESPDASILRNSQEVPEMSDSHRYKIVTDDSDEETRQETEQGSDVCFHEPLEDIQDIRTPQGLDKVVIQVKQWLTTCSSTHNCLTHQRKVGGLPQLPTRVLDVGTIGNPSLHLFVPKEGESADYISLSYCWGRDVNVKMTRATLEDMQKEIQLSTLPQTIQDAIIFTRQLGVRYLWVDALCIIQAERANDETHLADWMRETTHFGDYYKNALCTLAATGSHSVGEGLFLPSTDLMYPKYISTQGPDSSTRIWIPNVGPTQQIVWHSPLYERGWAVQERILSPRIIHFTRRFRIWECGELTASERCPNHENPVIDHDGSIDFVGELRQRLTFGVTQGIETIWTSLRNHYCQTNFTNLSDMLPALSGLARRVQELTGAKYYAGIWENEIRENLAWYTAVLRPESSTAGSQNETGPSWSLSSMGKGLPKFLSTRTAMFEWRWALDQELSVLDVDVQCVGRDTDGLVASGVLKLEGVYSTLDMSIVPYQRDPENPIAWNLGKWSIFQVYWDYFARDEEVLKTHRFLRIGTLTGDDDDESTGFVGAIILAPTMEEEGRSAGYRRQGFGFIPQDIWELGQICYGPVDLY